MLHPPRAAAASFLCLLALAAPAAATPLTEPVTGLELDLAAPGADVCVVLPRGAPNGDGCKEIDPAKAADTLEMQPSPPKGFAQVTVGDWSFLLLMEKYDLAPVRTAEQITDFVRVAAQGATIEGVRLRVHGDEKGTRYDLTKINGVDVIRTRFDLDVPEGSPRWAQSRVLLYTFVGKNGMASVAFTSDPEHAEAVRPIAEQMLAKATMPPLGAADFGKPAELGLGEQLQRSSSTIGVAAVALVSLLLILRWAKQKAPAK